MSDADCIFCNIVSGTIPSFNILETELVLSFMDINPASDGHALVIPKEHATDVFALSNESMQAVAVAAKQVAKAIDDELSPAGLNLIQANGPGAAQSVLHFHFHVLPRKKDDELSMNWPVVPGDMDRIGELAKRLRMRLRAD